MVYIGPTRITEFFNCPISDLQVEQPLISSEPQDKHGRSSSLIDLNSPTTQLDSESTRPSHLGTRLLVNLSASAQNFTTPNVDPEELLQFETQGVYNPPGLFL